ncbi:MAG: aminotransferase class IV [Succinivibrionaceae bacterium]
MSGSGSFYSNGYITEGCITNIFWENRGVIYTPELSLNILPGIMRSKVVESYRKQGIPVREGKYLLEDLLYAERIFVTNSLMGKMRAVLVNERL